MCETCTLVGGMARQALAALAMEIERRMPADAPVRLAKGTIRTVPEGQRLTASCIQVTHAMLRECVMMAHMAGVKRRLMAEILQAQFDLAESGKDVVGKAIQAELERRAAAAAAQENAN